jgi:hypothetical protein
MKYFTQDKCEFINFLFVLLDKIKNVNFENCLFFSLISAYAVCESNFKNENSL